MGSPIALQELFKAGFDDFAIPVYEDAPFTTIQNRAKVTRSLKAIAGVERVMVKGLSLLQNEFGPNGERVFEADTKDARIRMVGNWSSSASGSGTYVTSFSINDFVEITFYGTGINLVMYESSTVRDYRLSVDGGAEGSNIKISSYSNVLINRNYMPNIVFPLVSGLSLGWHTVRMRNNDASNGPSIGGFEVLNQRADLAVFSGAGVSKGNLLGLSALATSSFKEGVLGTRGARVVKYVENGELKTAVTEVNASSQFLSSADHSNEEVVRRINPREFGANRSDDISTATTAPANRAFTLDDGTTTVVASQGVIGFYSGDAEALFTNATNGFYTLTFVGTGLDIFAWGLVGTSDSHTIFVDGVSIGNMSKPDRSSIVKICSGLPYGTHTVRFLRNAIAGSGVGVIDFIIYQPKKPSIPAGALEVADYNVMADFSFNSTSSVSSLSQGVMRKSMLREMIYSGTWTANAVDVVSHASGFGLTTPTNGGYVEYTMFGTGFELNLYTSGSYSSLSTVSLNGVTATISNFPTAVFASTAPLVFNSATGTFASNITDAGGRRLSVSNLPLGLYRVRITNNTAATLNVNTFDVITPIHINESSLKIGSQSLRSLVKYSPEKSVQNAGPDLSKAKAWVAFTDTQILSSYNVSAILKGSTNTYDIFLEKPFKNANYIVTGSATGSNTSNGDGLQVDIISRFSNKASIGAAYNTGSGDGNAFNQTTMLYCCVVFFGELIDE